MFTKLQLEKYADVLIWGVNLAKGKKLKKGDVVSIIFNLAALPLAEVIYDKIMKMGMHPIFDLIGTSKIERSFYEEANDKQLAFITPGRKEFCRNLNARIVLIGPESLTHLEGIDTKKIGKAAVAVKPLREIYDEREALKEFGWTLCMVPTEALAEKANMSVEDYKKQVLKACYLNKKDPIQEWKNLYKKATKVKRWLNKMNVEYYHVKSKNIDLKVFPGEQRKWIGISGHNIPSFELFLSPDYHYTEGTFLANQPSFVVGNYIEWLKLEFKDGFVSNIECDPSSYDFVSNYLSTDKGAKAVGEFSLTDKRFSNIDKFMASTLYDENYGGRYGNCHIAVGSSYLDTYKGDASELDEDAKEKLGFNDSSIHWDVVNDEKKIVTAHLHSGKEIVIYKDGMFQCSL